MSSNIAGYILRLRTLILVLFAVAMAAAYWGVNSFKIAASADTLLEPNNRLYIQTQLVNQRFSPEEFILLAYEPTAHPLFSERTFKDLSLLTQQLAKLERVSAITSILTVPLIQDTSALSGGVNVEELSWQHQRYSPEEMERLVAGHPLFTDLLINRELTATAIQIVFSPNPTLAEIEQQIVDLQANVLERELTEQEQQQLEALNSRVEPLREAQGKQRDQEIEQINAIVAELDGGANVYLGGAYVVGYHLVNMITQDLVVFGSAIAVVIALMLAVLYRHIRWVIFPLLACAVSVWLTIGLLGFSGFKATVISANFIALQLILTLAVMLHIIADYRSFSRQEPDASQLERLKATLAHKIPPCFFATLTTSVGFASLIFSGLEPVAAFGWMMLIAMLVTMAVSLLLFPAMLSFFGTAKESNDLAIAQTVLGGFKRLAGSKPTPLIMTFLLMFAVMGWGISKLNVENSFIDYFAADSTVHKELAFIDQQFGGSTALDVIINVPANAQHKELVITADALNQLHLAQATVDSFDATGSVTSLVNFTTLARQLNDGRPLTEYELTSLYHLLDKAVVEQLVGAYFSPNNDQLRMAIRIQDTTDGLDRAEFMQQLRADLATAGLSEQDYTLTNLFVLYQDILARLFDSQITTLGIVYVVLALVMLVIFRSLTVALIALLPNVLTTLGILGVIGWLGIPLDIMTITIAAIAMGIAVDDTIHFVHAYLEGNAQHTEPQQVLDFAFNNTGLAILFTTTVIACGFSLFGFSEFLPSVYFGLLTALAMLMALVTDLTLLPALLGRFVVKRSNG